MAFTNIKSPGWTVGDSITAGQLNQIQFNMTKSLDIDQPNYAGAYNTVSSNNSFSGTNLFTGSITIPTYSGYPAMQAIADPIQGQVVRLVLQVPGRGFSNVYFEFDGNDTGTGAYSNCYCFKSTTTAGTWKPFNYMISPKPMGVSGIVVNTVKTSAGWSIGTLSNSLIIDTGLSSIFSNTLFSNSGNYATSIGAAIPIPKASYGGYVFDINFVYPYTIDMLGATTTVDTMVYFFLTIHDNTNGTMYPPYLATTQAYPVVIPANTPLHGKINGTLIMRDKLQVPVFDPAADDQFKIVLSASPYAYSGHPTTLPSFTSMVDSTGYSGSSQFQATLSTIVTAY